MGQRRTPSLGLPTTYLDSALAQKVRLPEPSVKQRAWEK